MKNWKQNAFFGFLAILVFTVALATCDNGNEQKPEHTCPPEATHFLTCDDYDCPIGGHEQTARGSVAGISIYQTAEVSDADAGTGLTNTQDAFAVMKPSTLDYIKANVNRIEMGGTTASINLGVLTIGTKLVPFLIAALLDDYVDSLALQLQLLRDDSIRLSKAPVDTKGIGRDWERLMPDTVFV